MNSDGPMKPYTCHDRYGFSSESGHQVVLVLGLTWCGPPECLQVCMAFCCVLEQTQA